MESFNTKLQLREFKDKKTKKTYLLPTIQIRNAWVKKFQMQKSESVRVHEFANDKDGNLIILIGRTEMEPDKFMRENIESIMQLKTKKP